MSNFSELIEKVYICHYTKLTDRFEPVNKQLSNYQLMDKSKWIIENDAEHINFEIIKNTMPNIQKPFFSRTLKISELSLILKHIKAFEDIVENGYTYSLVLEDDALFIDDFLNRLNMQMIDFNPNFDLIWVGTCCDLKSEYINSSRFLYPNIGSRCTHGYLISYKCAVRMLQFMKFNNMPMDFAFNKAISELNFVNYWMEPALIFQNPVFETSIQNDKSFI